LGLAVSAGGFGAAKNLCTWATEGKDCSVQAGVQAVLQAFHAEGKAIGLCCIAPVLAAKVIPGCEVTVGLENDDKWVPFTLLTCACRSVSLQLHF